MPGHASLTTILQAAAGRAWVRTRPVVTARRASTVTSKQGLGFVEVEQERDIYASGSVKSGLEIRTVGLGNFASVPSGPSQTRMSPKIKPSPKQTCPIQPHAYPQESSRNDVTDTLVEEDVSAQTHYVSAHGDTANLSSVTGAELVENLSISHEEPPCSKPLRPPDLSNHTFLLDGPIDEGSGLQTLINEGKRIRRFAGVAVGNVVIEIPMHISLPHDRMSLYRNLVQLSGSPLLSSNPPDKLLNLVAYYSRFPHLHMPRSYNLLISLAIAADRLELAGALLHEMKTRGFPMVPETRKLICRIDALQGHWTAALLREVEHGSPLLPATWIELFKSIGDSHPSSRARIDPATTESRYQLLIRHRPKAGLSCISPRTIYYQIRWMLRHGKFEDSLAITLEYFASLPRELDDVVRQRCTDIMNLHLRSVRDQKPSKGGWRVLPLMHHLLAAQPQMRPNPTTLFLVLSAPNHHNIARQTPRIINNLAKFQEKWGADVVDNRVLAWLTSSALKAKNVKLARYLMQMYTRRQASSDKLARESPESPTDRWKTCRPERRKTHAEVFRDVRAERQEWEQYEQRLLELRKSH